MARWLSYVLLIGKWNIENEYHRLQNWKEIIKTSFKENDIIETFETKTKEESQKKIALV